jgi:hypothetical protein
MLIALAEKWIKSMNRNWYVNSFNLNVDSINGVDTYQFLFIDFIHLSIKASRTNNVDLKTGFLRICV